MKTPEEREPPNVITSDTSNATTINPKEADAEDQKKFRRFRAYNRGTWNGPKRENKEVVRRQDDLHRYDSIAASLSLTVHQKNKGRKILDGFDLHGFGHTIDHIIFGICTLIANRDVAEGSRYYPNPEAAGDGDFETVADSLGLNRSDQLSAIERVRAELNK